MTWLTIEPQMRPWQGPMPQRERLGLVRPLCAEPCGAADLPNRHLLAAAGDAVVFRHQDRARRAVERIEKRADRQLAFQRAAQRAGAAIAVGRVDLVEE